MRILAPAKTSGRIFGGFPLSFVCTRISFCRKLRLETRSENAADVRTYTPLTLFPSAVFICGAADRSGRGKRCSSSSCYCCCWGGGHFSVSHVQFFVVWKVKNFVPKGVRNGKNCVYHGALICKKYYFSRRRSVKVSLSCSGMKGEGGQDTQ